MIDTGDALADTSALSDPGAPGGFSPEATTNVTDDAQPDAYVQPASGASGCDPPAATSSTPEVMPIVPMCICVATLHHCAIDTQAGCPSCGSTCHSHCDSELCAYSPCVICLSLDLLTHENAEICVDAQMYNLGCHACSQMGCWSAAYTCHSKCTRLLHVCGPSLVGGGCASCGKLCHENNGDLRCVYFRRDRNVLGWETDAQQLLDTQAGTDGSVPHMSQVSFQFVGTTTRRGASKLTVNGLSYYVGYGNPGLAINREFNNCLIDSMRQCLRVDVDRAAVRADLMEEFLHARGRANVTLTSYLDIDSHWRAILKSIYRHNASGLPTVCDPGNYCVIALSRDIARNVNVSGSLGARQTLMVLNDSDVHFDPCLPE